MKILAIASAGGHWVQLLRLQPAFNQKEVAYISTNSTFSETVKDHAFFTVPDASRWNKIKLLWMWIVVARIILVFRPAVIITTGAAPGLVAVITGRVMGIRTIWVDSIANAEKISLSGRIAAWFANTVYTQWPHLATGKFLYKGNVLS